MGKYASVFRTNVRRHLRLSGQTYKELGERIGSHRVVVGGWLTGKHDPGLSRLGLVSDGLEVPLSRLLTRQRDLDRQIHYTYKDCLDHLLKVFRNADKRAVATKQQDFDDRTWRPTTSVAETATDYAKVLERNVEHHLKNQKISFKVLAARMGDEAGILRLWLDGQRDPTLGKLERMSDALAVPLPDLLVTPREARPALHPSCLKCLEYLRKTLRSARLEPAMNEKGNALSTQG